MIFTFYSLIPETLNKNALCGPSEKIFIKGFVAKESQLRVLLPPPSPSNKQPAISTYNPFSDTPTEWPKNNVSQDDIKVAHICPTITPESKNKMSVSVYGQQFSSYMPF